LSSRVDVQGCLHKTCMPLPDVVRDSRSSSQSAVCRHLGVFLLQAKRMPESLTSPQSGTTSCRCCGGCSPPGGPTSGSPACPSRYIIADACWRSESLLKAVKVTYLQPCACRAWRQTLTGAAPCITQVVQIPNFASQYKSGDETPHLGLGHWAVVREAQRQVKCQ